MDALKKVSKFALVSVYNKKNIKLLCDILSYYKIGIISTGSTYKKIVSLGYDCFEISKLTKFKEVLDGRVKTLHPKIYISILHRRNNEMHEKTFNKTNFPRIDYVIVNLYPFSKFENKSHKEAIEMIDIGGPTLLRSAAKNYEDITVISSPNDYQILKNNLNKNSGITDLAFKKKMAIKTFNLTFKYDKKIHDWFTKKNTLNKIKLSYGENPDQKAVLIKDQNKSIIDYQIQGKKISYNNILDVDCGIDFLNEFDEPTTVIVKHNNACGVASSKTIKNSFIKAHNSDKKSAFGGVVLINRTIDKGFAKLLIRSFFQVLVAPGYTKDALEVFGLKKNLILLNSSKILKIKKKSYKSVRTGTLGQTINNQKLTNKNFEIVSRNKKISNRENEDILFAFRVVKHLKSNAIVIVKNKQTLGIGAGQMSRYDSTKIAVMKYKENFSLKNIVCASDAFFPFVDSLQLLLKNNCTCIVEPSGSVNDSKIIQFADKNNIKLVFSAIRVFKH